VGSCEYLWAAPFALVIFLGIVLFIRYCWRNIYICHDFGSCTNYLFTWGGGGVIDFEKDMLELSAGSS
jgi:hypothetical protein